MTLKETRRSRCPRGTHALGSFSSVLLFLLFFLKTFQTYTKNNPDTGQTYSGRTSGTRSPEENVILRDRSHHMNEEGYGPANLDKSSTNPAAIRGREQQLIDANGSAQSQGGTSETPSMGSAPQTQISRFTVALARANSQSSQSVQ
jgi:hypothetical protein